MVPGTVQNSVDGFYIGYKAVLDDTSSNKRPYVFKTVDVSREFETGSRTDFEIILNDLQRNTRYSIMVQAYNKKGPGPSSMDIIAQTSEFG